MINKDKNKYGLWKDRKVLLFLIILFCPLLTKAQYSIWNTVKSKPSDIQNFHEALKNINAVYTPPKKFVHTNVNTSYNFPNDSVRINPLVYSLMNKDSSIVIAFNTYIIGTSGNLYTSFIDNSVYLRTWNGGIKKFVNGFTRIETSWLNKIQASVGVSYIVPVTHSYSRFYWRKGKYKFLKTVVLQKKDVGGVKIHFFAEDESKEAEINRLIQQTWGMIQFKLDSTFNPDNRPGYLKISPQDEALIKSMSGVRNKYSWWKNNARLANMQLNYDTAEKYYLRMHELRPDVLEPYQKIFEMYNDAGNYKEAKKYWYEIKKGYLPPLDELKQKKKEDWFETIVDDKMEKAYGVTVLLQRDYASLLYNKREYNAAIEAYKKLLELRPNGYKTYFKLGLIYREKGEMNKAFPYYQKGQEISKKVTSHHTENTDVNYLLAMYYYHLKPPQKEKAKSYFKKAQLGGHVLPRNIKREFNLWAKNIPVKDH